MIRTGMRKFGVAVIKRALQMRYYSAILVLLLAAWSGFILRGKAPFMIIMPGCWSSCQDISAVFNSSYLSGHHALEGFSLWTFNESFGNNFYLHALARYFNPFNIVGSFLIDHFKIGVFQYYGFVSFCLFVVYLWSCLYFFKHVGGYSNTWAFFGALTCAAIPGVLYSARYINYFGIFAFFPFCLIAIDNFCKRISLQTCWALFAVLTIPLFMGMINLYINYAILAECMAFVFIMRTQDVEKRRRLFRLNLIIGAGVLVVTSIIWGPIAVEMISSTGQVYDLYELSTINPVNTLCRILCGHIWGYLNQYIDKSFVYPSVNCFLGLERLGLVLMLAGFIYSFRNRLLFPAIMWYSAVLGCGIIYYACQVFHWNSAIFIFNLLKPVKYQTILGAPFFAWFIVEGCRLLFNGAVPRFFKRLITAYFIALFSLMTALIVFYLHIYHIVSSRGFGSTLLGSFIHKALHSLPSAPRHDISFFPTYRWHLSFAPSIRLYYLLGLAITIIFLLWIMIMPRKHKAIKVVCLMGVIFSIGYHSYIDCGGYHVPKEVYAQEYYNPQENELIVKHLLEQESFKYRALYFDDLIALQGSFTESFIYKHAIPPEENRGSWFEFWTRKYTGRADVIGIPIADGWHVFPSHERREFFEYGHIKGAYFGNMRGLAWTMADPLNSEVASICNVKYVISHYPLPDLQLINSSNEYWGYLYMTKAPLPICRIVLREYPDLAVIPDARIVTFRLLPDRVFIRAFSDRAALLRLNCTYDRYWKVAVNGKICRPEILDGIFMGVEIPAGASEVVFTYDYWPLRLFIVVALIGVLLSFVLIRHYAGRQDN